MTKQEKLALYRTYKAALIRRYPILNTDVLGPITQDEVNAIVGEAINNQEIATSEELGKLGTMVAIKSSLAELRLVKLDPLGNIVQSLDFGIVKGENDEVDGMYVYSNSNWIKYTAGGTNSVTVVPTQEELDSALA